MKSEIEKKTTKAKQIPASLVGLAVAAAGWDEAACALQRMHWVGVDQDG